jgi:hypothetical protein
LTPEVGRQSFSAISYVIRRHITSLLFGTASALAETREIADEVLDLSGLRSGLRDEPFQRQSVATLIAGI